MADRFKIVVSDLHLGAGHLAEGNALEDFGCDDELASLLEEVAAESDREGAEVELIVNGDAFEMLQVPDVDLFDPRAVYRPEDYHSSSEVDSARKMALIISGHPLFFQALGRFVQPGPPRRSVTFIKGNHDVNLHWHAVQDQIRQAVGGNGDTIPLVAFEERRVSRDGIYVEHGNQYAESVSRVPDMEEPHDPDRPDQLALPFGSRFVIDFFNQVEREKYWVDGVKPIHALVWYALVYDFSFAARAIAVLLRSLPGVIEDGLLIAREPRADLVRQLEDPDRAHEISERHRTDGEFRGWFNAELSRLLPPPLELSEPSVASTSSLRDGVGVGDAIRAAVRSGLYKAAQVCAAQEACRLVVFGHTHEPGVEVLPGGELYINSGTWTWRGDFVGAGKETWRDLFEHPERFTSDRCLSYVRIDYDPEGRPVGRLLALARQEPPPPARHSWWDRLRIRLSRLWQWLREAF